MARSISNIRKKRGRGRPKIGAVPVMVRLLPEQAARLDAWRTNSPDRPGRPEAIRRLIDSGLASYLPDKQKAEEASALAARAADRVVDKTIPPKERERRKIALIKGPKEFRDIREDLPKPKKA